MHESFRPKLLSLPVVFRWLYLGTKLPKMNELTENRNRNHSFIGRDTLLSNFCEKTQAYVKLKAPMKGILI